MIEAAVQFLAITVGGFVICVVAGVVGVIGIELWDALLRALHR